MELAIARGKIKSTTITVFNGFKQIFITATNIFAKGNDQDSIDLVTPYGNGSIPPTGCASLFVPVGGSGKKYMCIGFVPMIPDIPHDFVEGESWQNSQKYVLAYQNDGLRAYRVGDEEFNTTLPNGESFVQMMLNRIDEMQAEIDWLKTHTHSGVSSGMGNTGVPTTPPPEPSTLDTDKSYLTEGKALIDDSGEIYS